MALQIDPSSPAAVVGTGPVNTATSGAIPANSRVVAYVMGDANSGVATEQITVTSTGGLSWLPAIRANGSPGADVEIWHAPAVSAIPAGIVVTATDNQGAVAVRMLVRVYTDDTGNIPAGIGATASGASGSVAYVSTVANSWGFSVALGGGSSTVPGTETLLDFDTSFDGGDGTAVVQQNSTTPTPGTTVTMSVTMGVTPIHHAAAEILPASAGSSGGVRAPVVAPTTAAHRAAGF